MTTTAKLEIELQGVSPEQIATSERSYNECIFVPMDVSDYAMVANLRSSSCADPIGTEHRVTAHDVKDCE